MAPPGPRMAQADGNRLKQIALAHATRFSTTAGLGSERRASEATLTIVIDRLGKAVYLGHGNRGWEERPGVTRAPREFDRSKALMNVTILVCACGKRVRARGKAGKSGSLSGVWTLAEGTCGHRYSCPAGDRCEGAGRHSRGRACHGYARLNWGRRLLA